MTAEEEIVRALTTDSAVAARVGDRAGPAPLPAKAALPAVTYQRISTRRPDSHGGDAGLAIARFQVNAIATAYPAAKALAGDVRQALNRAGRARFLDERQIAHPDERLQTIALDVEWHQDEP